MKVDIHLIEDPLFDCAPQINRLQHPLVTVFTTPHVKGNVLQARVNGFSMGTAPYVSWVDPDDEVVTLDWLAGAVQLLDADPSLIAVYPRWQSFRNGRLEHTSKGKPHHLTIMRRQPVADFMGKLLHHVGWTVAVQDLFLLDHLSRHGSMHELDVIAYRWLKRKGSAHQQPENPLVSMSWSKIRDW